MTVETYGPADLYVVAFPSEHVPGQIREAVLTTLSSGVITLLDLVLVRRAADGSTEVLEIESLGEEFDLDLVQTSGSGLVGQEDIGDATVDGLLIRRGQPGRPAAVDDDNGEALVGPPLPRQGPAGSVRCPASRALPSRARGSR